MSQKQTVIFEIVKTKQIALDLRLDTIRKYPVDSHYLHEAEKILLIYEFTPSKTNNVSAYLEMLKIKFKKQYKAYSVTVATPEKQLN